LKLSAVDASVARSTEESLEHYMTFSQFLPSRDKAVEIPWSAAIARQRGVYGFNGMDARSRSFNLVRGRLVTLCRERNWRTLGVVSATPGVGKSFVSANLAAAMSRDPRFDTVLIDLDLRRGTIKDIFGFETDLGISNFLSEEGRIESLPAFRPAGEKLMIVPNLPGNVRSSEMLAGSRMSDLMRALRASSDRNYFIFDLPPAYANDDAATIIEQLDCYVLIAEEGKSTQQEVESAAEMLGHERLAGVVLNKYRGGLISEGRGIEDRYASNYYASEVDDAQD
jgi:protein-tyrosine kinase